MVDRPNKPTALASTPGLPPQPQVNITHGSSRVSAVLPTGETVEILLHGATIISWKDAHGNEKLWLSEAAKLDGSKAVRGGIPLVFPVFGTAPDHAQTAKLPQHGFARTSKWDFMGKSTSEGQGALPGSARRSGAADLSVKLDFGLSSSSEGLDANGRAAWPYDFSLIYSVTLNRDSLTTTLVVTNDDSKPFDIQMLMHTYLRVPDITKVAVTGLEGAAYVDKVDGAKAKTESSVQLEINGETDRVYTPAKGPEEPVSVVEGGKTIFSVVRDNLGDVVVWNPWIEKAAGMGDFEPKDGYKNMLCIEAGSVKGWQTLEPGDAFEGAQTITVGSA